MYKTRMGLPGIARGVGYAFVGDDVLVLPAVSDRFQSLIKVSRAAYMSARIYDVYLGMLFLNHVGILTLSTLSEVGMYGLMSTTGVSSKASIWSR